MILFRKNHVKTKKKRSLPKNGTLFSTNSGENQTKKSSPKLERFFPRIEVETCAQMQTRVKLLGGMQMYTILELLGDTVKLLGGYIPHIPLGFGTPACKY